jgi:hypothetical protein
LLIALGAWMAYRQKSREHRRVNQLGVEVFDSYAAKLRAKTAGAARWLMVATLATDNYLERSATTFVSG